MPATSPPLRERFSGGPPLPLRPPRACATAFRSAGASPAQRADAAPGRDGGERRARRSAEARSPGRSFTRRGFRL